MDACCSILKLFKGIDLLEFIVAVDVNVVVVVDFDVVVVVVTGTSLLVAVVFNRVSCM